jgi:hypothetical protein
MKIKNPLFLLIFLFYFLGLTNGLAQIVDKVTVTAEETNIQFIAPNAYFLEIAGPDNYYFKKEIDYTQRISVSNLKADGNAFLDGSYTLQITPIVTLTPFEREELRALQADNDQKKIATFREEHGLPAQVDVHSIYFRIQNGKFVSPSSKEARGVKIPSMSSIWQQDHPAQYASLKNIEMEFGSNLAGNYSPVARDNTTMNEDDQVFFDDVIVVGSICVGQDCVNGENFGFDTGRYKENNLRVHFDDTSNSASFPKNDWRITINDSSNGGANYFAIEDVTAGRVPFRIIGGAPANSLYVDAQGDVGIGTATPVLELHINDGDTPTMRLQQDGSSGFGQQTWDVAGNETNFFIRDVTGGSKLPFKIKPGAPDNSIYIDAEGDIGLGTANPGSNGLQVESGNVYVKSGSLGVNVAPTFPLDVVGNSQFIGNVGINTIPAAYALDVLGNSQFSGTTLYKGDVSYFLNTGTTFLSPSFVSVLRIDASNNRVGIGTATPGHLLELNEDDAVKPNGGSWSAPSDKRLKTNIHDFNDGLNTILKIRPVTYNYNGKLGYPTDKEFVGVIAQEMQNIAPYTINALNHNREGENYLALDPSSLTYLLVNAVQEQQYQIASQQEEIETLKRELNEMKDLKEQVASLSKLVSGLSANSTGSNSSVTKTGEDE